MNKIWKTKPAIPEAIRELLAGYSPMMQQLMYNRGVQNIEEAENLLQAKINHDPFLFSDMDKVVALILETIDGGKRIAIYGDYDVDGITATVLLTQVLEKYGADVIAFIPDRVKDGYGVNTNAIERLAEQGVDLMITVDCGIRSPEELAFAKNLGMKVVVTDHHGIGETLPEVDGIICQHNEGNYPDKNLAGVGLAYKVAQALFSRRPLSGFTAEQWLDLVALGTVADVVPLIGENRHLVKQGLNTIHLGQRLGLKSLINVAGLTLSRVTATNISFNIAPRLNAAGRIKSPQLAVDLLMTDDVYRAGELAQELDNLNRKRQEETKAIQESVIEKLDLENNGNQKIFFAVDEQDVPQPGLVGLVAAKLTENHYRPSVILSKDEDKARASCRSIPEFHITNALDECEDLLVQHGGHAMAAGFTVVNENIGALAERLAQIAERELADVPLTPMIEADMEIGLDSLPKNVLVELDMLEPLGAENPQPLFISRNVEVMFNKAVGRDRSHLKLKLREKKVVYDGIAFNQKDLIDAGVPKHIDILTTIEHNYFNGQDITQLNIIDIKTVS